MCQLLIADAVGLDACLPVGRAEVSLSSGLAMADAIVYATALANLATLVNGDADL